MVSVSARSLIDIGDARAPADKRPLSRRAPLFTSAARIEDSAALERCLDEQSAKLV